MEELGLERSEDFAEAMGKIARDLDYSNFKSELSRRMEAAEARSAAESGTLFAP